MCSTMPRPESRVGVVQIDLDTEKPMGCLSLFRNQHPYDEFMCYGNAHFDKSKVDGVACDNLNSYREALFADKGIAFIEFALRHDEADCFYEFELAETRCETFFVY